MLLTRLPEQLHAQPPCACSSVMRHPTADILPADILPTASYPGASCRGPPAGGNLLIHLTLLIFGFFPMSSVNQLFVVSIPSDHSRCGLASRCSNRASISTRVTRYPSAPLYLSTWTISTRFPLWTPLRCLVCTLMLISRKYR